MTFARKKRKQEQRKKTLGAGSAAGLAALGGAVLFWRKNRRKPDVGVSQTQPEVVTGQAHGEAGGIDDTTLARKVETEIFRDDSVPKGDTNINSEFGVVFLRG